MAKKKILKEVRAFIESEKYTLVAQEYINAHTKLTLMCPKNHEYRCSWSNFHGLGRRCSICSGRYRHTIETVKEFAKQRGFKCLSETYVSTKHYLQFKCSLGHKFSMVYNNFFHRKDNCPICKYINMMGSNHPNWKEQCMSREYCDLWLDKEYKESILERDNYECQNPDCWKVTDALDIHHINYNKKNCTPSNLITVCKSCNGRANFNRDKWNEFYSNLILKREKI